MSDFWSNVLGGGGQLFGYSQLLDDLSTQRDDLGSFFQGLTQQVTDAGEFVPSTIRSGLGNISMGENGMTVGLSDAMSEVRDRTRYQGMEALMNAAGDPAQREQEIYDRMRAAQMPGEQRAQNQMQQSMLNRGRSGITTNAYGGSSEQFAHHQAVQEAQNQAMLGAMGQAQNELTNQLGIGQGLMAQSYMPYQQQMQMAGLGLNQSQLLQNSALNNQNMLAQLGLGQMTGQTNLSNIMGNAFGNMVTGGSGMLSGLGGALDDAGGLSGLWDTLRGWL